MALTARQVFEATLTELSKVNAPSLLLHEFNYYFNKAIRQYTNKRYNIYDVSQQTTDDLRVLKSEAKISITQDNRIDDDVFGATYWIVLPDDYLHLLNCICIFELKKNNRCYNKGDKVPFSAKRLTGDSWSEVINDYYNRPLPERPYYYIHNTNQSTDLPTNEYSSTKPGSTDQVWTGTEDTDGGYTEKSTFPRTIKLGGVDTTVIERPAGLRYANPSKVRCEIRYGYDTTVFELKQVRIDYIKAPQNIRLTQEQVNLTEDTSQVMEFPDYVCQEIINELVLLVMQREADPRLQTQPAVTQSIANPAQQQTPQPQPRRGS